VVAAGFRVAVDAMRLALVEVWPDDKQDTTVGFLLRAVAWFNSRDITCRRVLPDNGLQTPATGL